MYDIVTDCAMKRHADHLESTRVNHELHKTDATKQNYLNAYATYRAIAGQYNHMLHDTLDNLITILDDCINVDASLLNAHKRLTRFLTTHPAQFTTMHIHHLMIWTFREYQINGTLRLLPAEEQIKRLAHKFAGTNDR